MVSEQGPAPTGVTRRERQRLRFLDEIKTAASSELRAHGAAGVTMRAVARAIDITPSGLYRYVSGHEALLGLLATDSLTQLAEEVVAAAQSEDSGATHASRWFAGCMAMRQWALAHPAEYGLVFDSQQTHDRPQVVAAEVNPVLAAFSAVCAGALENHEIASEQALLADLGDSASRGQQSSAELLAAAGVACLVGHLSIEIGGRIESPLATEEAYPVFVRAVMRLLGFTEQEQPRARARRT